MSGGAGSARGGGALRTLGERLARHSFAYTLGAGLDLFLGLIRLILLTAVLGPSEFGRLAILLFLAGLITTVCRIAIVTGTIASVFKGGDDDEEFDIEGDTEEDPEVQKRMLGTGLLGSIALAAALAGVAALFAETIDTHLLGSGDPAIVVWAVALGGLGATWRLVSAIPRLERRPPTYIALQTVYAVFGVGLAVALIEGGGGLEGAVAGLTLGSVAAIAVGMVATRHRFRAVLDRGYALTLARRGAPFIAITTGFWLFRNADIYMASRYLSDADVGVYRAAQRIGGLSSSAVTALLLAWGPLTRGALRGALHREGALQEAGARLLTYFWMLSCWLAVLLVLLAGLLVKIVPADFGAAESLIPLLGIAGLASSGLMVVYRTSLKRGKRRLFNFLAPFTAATLVGFSVVLIPPFEAEGVAIAVIAAATLSMVILMLISQRGEYPLQIPWPRLALAAALAAGWALGVEALAEAGGGASLAIELVGVALFPLLLIGAGALPLAEARRLARLLQGAFTPGGGGVELADLDRSEQDLLRRLLAEAEPSERVAAELGIEPEAALASMMTSIRALAGAAPSGSLDVRIAQVLVSQRSLNERDRDAHHLALSDPATALEIDAIVATAERLRRLRPRAWPQSADGTGAAGRTPEAS